MLLKSLALLAAFAAFVPAFAIRVPRSPETLARDIIGIGVGVDNVLNNATINILSSRETYGCTVAEVDTVVRNVGNVAGVEALSKRSTCNVFAIMDELPNVLSDLYDSAPPSRGEGCSEADVTQTVYYVASDKKIPIEKRSDCDFDHLLESVEYILAELHVIGLTTKREEFSLASFADNM